MSSSTSNYAALEKELATQEETMIKPRTHDIRQFLKRAHAPHLAILLLLRLASVGSRLDLLREFGRVLALLAGTPQGVQDSTHEDGAKEILEREEGIDVEKREESEEDEEDDDAEVEQRVVDLDDLTLEVEHEHHGRDRARLRHTESVTQRNVNNVATL